MDARDSLLLLELDKGGEALGPLFEEPRRRLETDPKLRAAWSQFQALRALAWEDAPAFDEKLVKQAIQAGRRQDVARRLARAAGSDDAARDLLLSPRAAKAGLPSWGAMLLLLLALGLGWMAFKPSLPWMSGSVAGTTTAAPLPEEKTAAGIDFEFPAQTPEAAALEGPAAADDETKAENPNARAARLLLRQHLAAQQAPKAAPTPRPTPVQSRPAPTKALMAPVATAVPTPAPTVVPTAVPTLVPTAVPTVLPTIQPSPVPTAAPAVAAPAAEASSAGADLKLTSEHFPSTAELTLPGTGAVDLRLFNMRGQLVRRYLEKDAGPGTVRVKLDALDDNAQALPAGTYYLRALTRWFSKVEALENK
jgi:hypothetical protein